MLKFRSITTKFKFKNINKSSYFIRTVNILTYDFTDVKEIVNEIPRILHSIKGYITIGDLL